MDRRSACFLLLLLLQLHSSLQHAAFIAQQAVEIIFDGMPTFSDEVKDPKYQVIISRHTAPENKSEQQAHLRPLPMRDSSGREYTCYLPADTNATSEFKELKSGAELLPSELLKGLEDSCFYRMEDWWTYEVCIHQQIRQYHKEGDAVVAEYSLGNFTGNTSSVDDIHYDDRPPGMSAAYVSEAYENGTACDVANTDRVSELRYICAEDDKNALLSVHERSSCSYEIVLASPLICAHPAFKEVVVPVQDISCYPVVRPEFRPQELDGVHHQAGRNSSTMEGKNEGHPVDEPLEEDEGEVDLFEAVASGKLLDMQFDEATLDQIVEGIMRAAGGEDPDSIWFDLSEGEEGHLDMRGESENGELSENSSGEQNEDSSDGKRTDNNAKEANQEL